MKFRWHFNLRETLEIAKLGFPESALSMFIVLMEMAVNGFTLNHYGAAGVAAVSVVVNIFEMTFYLSEGISEYTLVAVNDSIGKNSSASMDRAIRTTLKAALIEELYMLIAEKNEGRQVLSELTVFLRPEGVQLISKDDGVLFDISEEDVSVTSIASFVVSNYMEKLGDDKRHLTTMSYNCSAFLIQTAAD